MYTRFSGKRQKNKMEINKRKFYRQVFALVIPMALQNLINVGVTAADVLMLGRVSEKVLSGASLAGQIQFVMTLILFGTTSGATVLTAQYWGKKDPAIICKFGAWRRCYFIVQAADDAYGGSDTYRNRLSDGHDLY